MSKKMTNQEVVDAVENEGLGYFLTSYADPEEIADPELRALGIAASKALGAFEYKLDCIKAELEDEQC